MKRLFLHAGKHKTGSTAFQKYLGSNKEFLEGRGIHIVPNVQFSSDQITWKPSYNCHGLAHILLRPELLTPMRIRQIKNRKRRIPSDDHLQRANDLLHSLPSETLLVSAEVFSFLRTEDEKKRFDIVFAGLDVRPIVVFREPESWMESWRRQVSVLDRPAEQDGKADSIFDFSIESWLMNDDAIRSFFSPYGTFLDYAEIMARHGSVIPGLLEALDLNPSDCPPWPDYQRRPTEKRRRRAI